MEIFIIAIKINVQQKCSAASESDVVTQKIAKLTGYDNIIIHDNIAK